MGEMVYNFPPAIHFGWGEAERVGRYVHELECCNALIVTDNGVERAGLLEGIGSSLEKEHITYTVYDGVQPNPTDRNVEEGLKVCIENKCNVIIAVGGGSPMDAAKGIILMANHPGKLEEYYRGAEPRRPVTADVPNFIAIPTTSGTGSEVSRGAIITSTIENRKRAIGSRYLLPPVVVLDPALTVSMPPKLTAHTGLDALSHSVEAFVVNKYAPIADAFAREGIRLVVESLVKAYDDGNNKRARKNMMMASTMGAMAFQKGLGVVHSLAHQLSPQTGVPHGAACGIMLPHAIRFNLAEGPAIDRVAAKYAEIAQIFGVDTEGLTKKQMAGEASEVIHKLLLRLQVPPRLKDWGVTEEDIQVMSENAMLDHCHPRNPRTCKEADMKNLFKTAL